MDQRKLIDDLAELEVYCESTERNRIKIKDLLHKLLSASNKSFEIVIYGKRYDFFVPFTKEEFDQITQMRVELVDQIMGLAYSTGNWDYILFFASGMDPIDQQCEKVDMSELYPVVDENGKPITALDLNYDSYQVKSNLLQHQDEEHVVQAETLDTF